jgi:hypothetical protein
MKKHLRWLGKRFEKVEDVRREHPSKRWSLPQAASYVLRLMLQGFPSALAADEAMTEGDEALWLLGQRERIPDSTYQEWLAKQPEKSMSPVLPQWIRWLWRSKVWQRPPLEPGQKKPLGTFSIDGKDIGQSTERAVALLRQRKKVLRAQWNGPWGPRLILGQSSVARGTNEMGAFPAFWNELMAAYGRFKDWLECVTLDAGYASAQNAELIAASGRLYVISLKENQPGLLAEAQRLLEPLMKSRPGRAADAYRVEKYQGRVIVRELWRNSQIAGWMDWHSLQEVWLVRQEHLEPDGKRTVEMRYFLSSLPPRRLNSEEVLDVVRGHWSVENQAFWRLDMQFDEDARRFAGVGEALPNVGLLRVLAFNTLMLLRQRSLRLLRPARESLVEFIRWARECLVWLAGYLRGLRHGAEGRAAVLG